MARPANRVSLGVRPLGVTVPRMAVPSRMGSFISKEAPAHIPWTPGSPMGAPRPKQVKRNVGGATIAPQRVPFPCSSSVNRGLVSPMPWAKWRIVSEVAFRLKASVIPRGMPRRWRNGSRASSVILGNCFCSTNGASRGLARQPRRPTPIVWASVAIGNRWPCLAAPVEWSFAKNKPLWCAVLTRGVRGMVYTTIA